MKKIGNQLTTLLQIKISHVMYCISVIYICKFVVTNIATGKLLQLTTSYYKKRLLHVFKTTNICISDCYVVSFRCFNVVSSVH